MLTQNYIITRNFNVLKFFRLQFWPNSTHVRRNCMNFKYLKTTICRKMMYDVWIKRHTHFIHSVNKNFKPNCLRHSGFEWFIMKWSGTIPKNLETWQHTFKPKVVRSSIVNVKSGYLKWLHSSTLLSIEHGFNHFGYDI